MAAVAVRRCLGLLALAEPCFFVFGGFETQALIGRPFDFFMVPIAKGLLFAQSTGAPGIGLPGFEVHATGLFGGGFGKAFIGDQFVHASAEF